MGTPLKSARFREERGFGVSGFALGCVPAGASSRSAGTAAGVGPWGSRTASRLSVGGGQVVTKAQRGGPGAWRGSCGAASLGRDEASAPHRCLPPGIRQESRLARAGAQPPSPIPPPPPSSPRGLDWQALSRPLPRQVPPCPARGHSCRPCLGQPSVAGGGLLPPPAPPRPGPSLAFQPLGGRPLRTPFLSAGAAPRPLACPSTVAWSACTGARLRLLQRLPGLHSPLGSEASTTVRSLPDASLLWPRWFCGLRAVSVPPQGQQTGVCFVWNVPMPLPDWPPPSCWDAGRFSVWLSQKGIARIPPPLTTKPRHARRRVSAAEHPRRPHSCRHPRGTRRGSAEGVGALDSRWPYQKLRSSPSPAEPSGVETGAPLWGLRLRCGPAG